MDRTLRHAQVLVGGADSANRVFDLLAVLGFERAQNPDWLEWQMEVLGIEEARHLQNWSLGKPLLGEIKAAMCICQSLTLEAQNALLKVFEEPPANTYFFLVLPSLANLLPTLLSRMQIIEASSLSGKLAKSTSAAKKFFESDISGRLAVVNKLSKAKDKNAMQEIVSELELVAKAEGAPLLSLEKILLSKTLVSARGSSPRQLLEWLACVI